MERIIKKKRKIASDVEHAEPLTDDETASWERILGKAAGDPDLFERKRREAQTSAKLGALKEERRLASLPKRPLYAEPGSVSLPEYACHSWLVDDGAREGDWTLPDVGLLVGLLGAFANRDARLVVGGRFEEDDAGLLTLVAPPVSAAT